VGNSLQRPSSRRWRFLALAVLLLAAVSSAWFGLRTYGSLRMLQSAQTIGQPRLSSVRGWMTLEYVAKAYGAPLAALKSRLGLAPDAPASDSLKTLAARQGMATFDYVRRVQRELNAILPRPSKTARAGAREGWLDWVVSSVLTVGYPALALILFLGAVGLPLPAGVSATLAGSLVALGHMHWLAVASLVVGASVLGDVAGFGIGKWVGGRFLARHGRWIGYSPQRHARMGALFGRLGGMAIVLTRTLVSSLSSLVNLFAGASRYPPARFLAFSALGRALWTAAYVGLGYTIAGDVEAAAEFLKNLTGLLISFAVCAGMILLLAYAGAFAHASVNAPGDGTS
jgi:membrane protein DedA with SNARE-associated domain